MKRSPVLLLSGIIAVMSGISFPLAAWEHHTLITRPLASNIPELVNRPAVEVVALDDFLVAMEETLATVLAEQEQWARQNLDAYAPRPDALAFQATGNAQDIRQRFFQAIRIHPESKAALYLSSLVEDPDADREGLSPGDVTLVTSGAELRQFRFDPLAPGDLVSPLDVLVTASHEPDDGLELGLFEDNGTAHGNVYGFGLQPFGDPNLEYGSQAPFHMGFYHESWLVFLFASFLKETYPEYRIHLYKTLSQAAFDHGQDYWGWRFMGWGLHYVTDLSMPYHTTVLPGYSTIRMLWINLLDMLGFPRQVTEALQLVSNRHMALERYQGILFERMGRGLLQSDGLLEALQVTGPVPAYTDSVPRKEIARKSNGLARKMDKALTAYMPERFVSDPSIELGNEEDLDQIVELIEAAHGADAICAMNAKLTETLALFGIHGRSYIEALMPQ